MHEILRPLSEVVPLRDPVLIAGFAGDTDTTAASAIAYLVEQWAATPLAEFDPDTLFDFTAHRPIVRVEHGERVLEWPTNRLYVASPGGERDIVLLAGVEPHLRWRAFCEALSSFMQDVGANTSLTLAVHPSSTPHTRAASVRLTASDEEYGREFGLEPTISDYQGPTGIVGVLNAHQRAQGFRNASLSTLTPFYANRQQNPHAMIALIAEIDRALGTSTNLSALRAHAARFDDEAEGAMQESEQLRTLVRSLEERFDSVADSSGALTATSVMASDLPSSDEVIADLEQFLRQQRDAGGHGPNGNAAMT